MHISMNMFRFRILCRPNPQLRCFPTHLVNELPGPTLQQLFRLVLLTQGHIARLDRGPFEQCSRWRLRQRKHRSKSNTACTLSDQVNILPFLGFQNTDCLVNDFIMPMQPTLNFHLCPSLEACNTKWCPWDEVLDSNKRVHFLIAEPALYHRMADFASRHNIDITLSTSNEPERNVTAYVELHLLSHVETVELLGRLYREFRTERLLSWRHMFWVDRFIHEHSMIREYIRSWGSRKRSVISRVGSRPHCSGTNKIHILPHYMETSIFWIAKNGWSPPVARLLPEIFRWASLGCCWAKITVLPLAKPR